MKHDFPGNARELENIMQHAFVLCKNSAIQVAHLPADFVDSVALRPVQQPLSLETLEKRAIEEALRSNDDNKTLAAKQLGINPSTLYRKLKRYGM